MERTIKKIIALAIAMMLTGAGSVATAQSIPTAASDPDEQRSIFTFQVDNDFFNIFSKADRDYTNGVRFGWLSPACAYGNGSGSPIRPYPGWEPVL